ncbi:hypothetical protein [Streptomyces sp. NPDC087300]|uniref:hypothetical protein n=1 Tax=Streptomyces sp. NPDC087300 TaxID=3365780 RepID=UPI00380A2A1B
MTVVAEAGLVRSEAGAEVLGEVRGEVFRGDAADAADARNAAVGVDRLYLAHPFSEGQIAAEVNLGDAAIEAGARRIVKLGARRLTGQGTVPDAVTGNHDVIAERLRRAGVPELTVAAGARRPLRRRPRQDFRSRPTPRVRGTRPDLSRVPGTRPG